MRILEGLIPVVFWFSTSARNKSWILLEDADWNQNNGPNQRFGQEAKLPVKEFFCEGFLNEDFQREVFTSRFFLFLLVKI